MTTCVTCKQPILPGELKAMNGDWHVHPGDCVWATARRCMSIIADLGDLTPFGPHDAYLRIEEEFGLKERL